MNSKTGRGADQFMVRLPEGMRDRIRLAAERNGRSMNAEVVATLSSAYPEPTVNLDEIADLVAADGKPRTVEHDGKKITIYVAAVVKPDGTVEDK